MCSVSFRLRRTIFSIAKLVVSPKNARRFLFLLFFLLFYCYSLGSIIAILFLCNYFFLSIIFFLARKTSIGLGSEMKRKRKNFEKKRKMEQRPLFLHFFVAERKKEVSFFVLFEKSGAHFFARSFFKKRYIFSEIML